MTNVLTNVPTGLAAGGDMWPCLGRLVYDLQTLMVFWECTWHSEQEYKTLRRTGHGGWIVCREGQDQFLVAWEPTFESILAQPPSEALPLEPIVEIRKNRPGLLGYVAAKYLPTGGGPRLAFLASWRISPIPKSSFLQLKATFHSHRGYVVHTKGDKVWVQWEPTWVYYEDVSENKKDFYFRIKDDPEALLRQFHRIVVCYSSPLAVKNRLE